MGKPKLKPYIISGSLTRDMIETAMSKKTVSTKTSSTGANAARWRAEVEGACERKGLLLTPLRRQVE